MDYSPAQRTWRRFKKNKLAVSGVVIIVLMILTGVLGYLVMPDKSPMANNMLLQLSIKKPGSSFTILKVNQNRKIDTLNFLQKMLYGQPLSYRQVPITSYRFKADSIIVREYIGDEEVADESAFSLREVLGTNYSIAIDDLRQQQQLIKDFLPKNKKVPADNATDTLYKTFIFPFKCLRFRLTKTGSGNRLAAQMFL